MAQTRGKAGSKQRELEDAALDALLGEGSDPTNPTELGAVFRRLQKRIVERMLEGELTHHLGYAPGEDKPAGQANHRNGSTPKTVLTDDGRGAARHAARSGRDIHPAGRAEGRPPPPRVRYQGALAVRARADRPRNPRPPRRAIPDRDLAADVISTVTDEVARRGHRLAAAAARAGLSRGDPRRVAGQDSRRRRRPEQGRVPRDRHYARGARRTC